MKAEFTPIAMRCNEEQFKAIEPKLKGFNIDVWDGFDNHPYLTFKGKEKGVGNYKKHILNDSIIYETWNEETFLNACGIETEETFTVSKSFILDAHSSACPTWKEKIEKEFPSLFVKEELELNKWYKVLQEVDTLWFLTEKNKDDGHSGYGFCCGGDFKHCSTIKTELFSLELATPQEVETALINEAKKRGFKEGVKIKSLIGNGEVYLNSILNEYKDNMLYMFGCCVFKNGIWAEILPQPTELTVAEIEAKLGFSIKIIK